MYTSFYHILMKNRCTQAGCYDCHLWCMKQTQSETYQAPWERFHRSHCAMHTCLLTSAPCSQTRSGGAGCWCTRDGSQSVQAVLHRATPLSSQALPSLRQLVCTSKSCCVVSLWLLFLLISELIKYLQVS